MLADHLKSKGCSELEIDQHLDENLPHTESIQKKRRAYAGWLLLSREFRQDRDAFQQAWQTKVRDHGYFKRFPSSFIGETGEIAETDQDYTDAYTIFYSRWCLDSMQTWELPSPMFPELKSPTFYYMQMTRGVGVNVFLPWYLLRDKQLKLDDVIRPQQRMSAPDGLDDWLEHRPKNFGYEQLALIPEIYLVIDLCLNRRYPDRVAGNKEKIDLAISHVRYGPGPEAERFTSTIKKVRQHMQRSLSDKSRS